MELLDLAGVLAAFNWDPQLRGFLIFAASVIILPGSVYLLLATNLGARVGFAIALAGLSGWMFVMGVVWAVFGIGLKGEAPHWEIKEVVTGDLGASTVEAVEDLDPAELANAGRGEWQQLESGDKILADAQAAADAVLAPSAGGGGHGESAGPEIDPKRFPSPYKSTTEYLQVTGFHKGGDNELFTIGRHKFFFRHSPHYAIVQVQGVEDADAVPTEIDENADVVSVIMLRNLGNLRQKSALLALASLLVFAVTCWSLHARDKEILEARSGAKS